ncbi:hypothetical protein [Novosphingobium sp. Chol11]|uniref:hypothetical protein n=1 Tax=Novosphingobium sp. Chol11 TaxID=1385763 RepID=UPI0025D5C917|nr:hypothetical protein [Novosphingobium sp. Chol11]
MSMHFRAIAQQAAANGEIDAEEVLQLRRAAWPDGVIDPDEADAILTINDLVLNKGPEWTDFLIEAVCEYMLRTDEPRGYVSPAKSAWLIAALDRDGQLDSMTELELLVRVMEKALGTPDELKAYALKQIERAVVFGTGPTRDGGALHAGSITETECQLLRRIIFASGGDGPARVSKAEAEMLFRVKDASLGAVNAPEWERLFVQGVGNAVQGWQAAQGLTRERAAELEAFMNDHTSRVGSFLTRMARFERPRAAAAARDTFGEAQADGAVSPAEQGWLDGLIGADGETDPLERALLVFLSENACKGED